MGPRSVDLDLDALHLPRELLQRSKNAALFGKRLSIVRESRSRLSLPRIWTNGETAVGIVNRNSFDKPRHIADLSMTLVGCVDYLIQVPANQPLNSNGIACPTRTKRI